MQFKYNKEMDVLIIPLTDNWDKIEINSIDQIGKNVCIRYDGSRFAVAVEVTQASEVYKVENFKKYFDIEDLKDIMSFMVQITNSMNSFNLEEITDDEREV